MPSASRSAWSMALYRFGTIDGSAACSTRRAALMPSFSNFLTASSFSRMDDKSRMSRLSPSLPSRTHCPNCCMKDGSCSRRSRSDFFS